MHSNTEYIIHAILLIFQLHINDKQLLSLLSSDKKYSVTIEFLLSIFVLHHCEQMETDSDLIGQLPIIDRPASVVL